MSPRFLGNKSSKWQKLALKLEEVVAKQASKNLVKSGENYGKGLQNSAKAIKKIDTRKVIAKQAKDNQGKRTDICQKSDKSNQSIDTKKVIAKQAGVS